MEKMQENVPNVKLREQRDLKRKTQAEIADIIGVTEITVGRWERGQAFPTPYCVTKLCRYFEKTPEELGLVPQTRAASVFPQASEPANEVPIEIDISASSETQTNLPLAPTNQPVVPTSVPTRRPGVFPHYHSPDICTCYLVLHYSVDY